ncbi:MAG: hypothetical protein KF803_05140 [Cyclobacteriaceae bacterium]|nr:hypothetical protein [Cyclobacteriaceae bacterium]
MMYSILIIFSLTILAGIYFLFLRFNALINTNHELQRALAQAHKVFSDEKAAYQQQANLLQKQARSNEELLTAERKRIAADLHDDIIQRMVVVRFRLEQLLYFVLPKRAESEVQSLHKELEHIMADIRYLIDDLVHPKFESQTFTELVKGMAERLSRVLHRKVKFELQHEEQEFHIAPSIKRELYYIVQEAAQNSLNHSVAFILQISLSWQNGLLVIIEDDGQGLLERGRGEGYGVSSIQRRAEAIGANLEIKSTSRGLVIVLEYKNL